MRFACSEQTVICCIWEVCPAGVGSCWPHKQGQSYHETGRGSYKVSCLTFILALIPWRTLHYMHICALVRENQANFHRQALLPHSSFLLQPSTCCEGTQSCETMMTAATCSRQQHRFTRLWSVRVGGEGERWRHAEVSSRLFWRRKNGNKLRQILLVDFKTAFLPNCFSYPICITVGLSI